MNDKKIVFLDIDGTLYDNINAEIPTSAIDGLRKLDEQGDVDIVIATGRPYFMIHHLDPIIKYVKAFVLINGQYVLYDNEVVYEQPLPVHLLKKLEQKARELNIAMGFVGKDQAYITEYNDAVKTNFKQFNIEKVNILENGIYDYQIPVFEGWIFAPRTTILDIKREIPEFDYMLWGNSGCDVVLKGASKQDGIKKLIEKLGYDWNETYAFGDAENDILMFRCCGCSVVMGNANDDVKQHATMVTDRVDQDGLYKGLIKCGLLRNK